MDIENYELQDSFYLLQFCTCTDWSKHHIYICLKNYKYVLY